MRMRILALSCLCILTFLSTAGVQGNSTSTDLTVAGLPKQSEKSTEFMIVKKKDGYKKKFIIKTNTEDQIEGSSLAAELDGILNQTRLERQKRQSDSTTEVVGLALNQEAMSGGGAQYETLKRGARSVSRAKRSLSFSFSKFFELGPRALFRPRRRLQLPKYGPPGYTAPPPITIYTSPPVLHAVHTAVPLIYSSPAVSVYRNFMTRIQRVWNNINYNYELARRFLLSQPVQSNGVLPRIVVTNPRGVTCADVCDPQGGVGYGTIGICTEKFCKCDFSTWQLTRYDCPQGCVFDPQRLVCDYPQNTVLCSDDDEFDDNNGNGYNNNNGFDDNNGYNTYIGDNGNGWQNPGGYGGYSKKK